MDQITVGAAVLVATIAFGAISTRWLLAPEPQRGRHRPGSKPLPPVEAMDEATAHCRAEARDTVHARTRITGELICRSCGHISTALPTATIKGD